MDSKMSASLKPNRTTHFRHQCRKTTVLSCHQSPGANFIKLFLSVIYEFSYKASVSWNSLEKLAKDKHSVLLQKFVEYNRKKFYNIGHRCLQVRVNVGIQSIVYIF